MSEERETSSALTDLRGAVAVITLPMLRKTGLAERWRQLPAKTRNAAAITGIVAALAVSEGWQLARFGLL